MLTFHFVHSGFDGGDMANVNWPVVNHIGGQCGRRLIIRDRAEEGIGFSEAFSEGEKSRESAGERIRICL